MTSTSKAYIFIDVLQRQTSTPVVVVKENLKQIEIKGNPLQNKKNQNDE